jgi:hypothetical protein
VPQAQHNDAPHQKRGAEGIPQTLRFLRNHRVLINIKNLPKP